MIYIQNCFTIRSFRIQIISGCKKYNCLDCYLGLELWRICNCTCSSKEQTYYIQMVHLTQKICKLKKRFVSNKHLCFFLHSSNTSNDTIGYNFQKANFIIRNSTQEILLFTADYYGKEMKKICPFIPKSLYYSKQFYNCFYIG